MATGPRKTSGGSGACRDSVLSWESVPIAPVVDAEPVPPGWITAAGFAAMRGIGLLKSQRALSRMVSEGLAETRKFRVRRDPASRPYPTPHYRLKK